MATAKSAAPTPKRIWLKRLIILLVVVALIVVSASMLAGYGLNLRGFGRAAISLARVVLDRSNVTALNQGDFRNIIFVHHSVGTNLLNDTDLRQQFTDAGYHLWDHGYNWEGLRDPAGNSTGYSYNIPGDGSDPHDYQRIFAQPIYNTPINVLSSLMQYEVIMFKSCFPANSIQSDQQLQDYKTWYVGMRDFMDQHPEKIFIAFTPPPLVRKETTVSEAQRARQFADWLTSGEFTNGHPNVFVFDLFGLLADDNPQSPTANTLRPDYSNGEDSHPTKAANEVIAPQLVGFVTKAIEGYRQRSQ